MRAPAIRCVSLWIVAPVPSRATRKQVERVDGDVFRPGHGGQGKGHAREELGGTDGHGRVAQGRNLKPRAAISTQRQGGDGRQILRSGKSDGESCLPGFLPFDARVGIVRFRDVDEIRQAVGALRVDRGCFGLDRERWVRCEREVVRVAGRGL